VRGVVKNIRLYDERKEKDKKRKETIETRNQADTTIYETEKAVNEHRSKVSAEIIEEVEKETVTQAEALQKKRR